MIKANIYKLVCPLTNMPFYVGSTTHPLPIRLSAHKWSSKNGNTKVATYMRDNNIIPTIELIKSVNVKTRKELRQQEYKVIENMNLYYILTNTITKEDSFKGDTETIKLKESVVKKVKENKRVTGVPISTFIEKLIDTALPDKPKK